MIDYSTWQPIPGTGEPDQQRDLNIPGDISCWAQIGPEIPGSTWSWTILAGTEGSEVDGGIVASEAEAKQAVQEWVDKKNGV